jgi:hypothetical protein
VKRSEKRRRCGSNNTPRPGSRRRNSHQQRAFLTSCICDYLPVYLSIQRDFLTQCPYNFLQTMPNRMQTILVLRVAPSAWIDGRSPSRCHFAFPTMHSNERMAFVKCHPGRSLKVQVVRSSVPPSRIGSQNQRRRKIPWQPPTRKGINMTSLSCSGELPTPQPVLSGGEIPEPIFWCVSDVRRSCSSENV